MTVSGEIRLLFIWGKSCRFVFFEPLPGRKVCVLRVLRRVGEAGMSAFPGPDKFLPPDTGSVFMTPFPS